MLLKDTLKFMSVSVFLCPVRQHYVSSCNAACPVYGFNPGLFPDIGCCSYASGYYYSHFMDLAFGKGTEQKSIIERLREIE